MRPAARPLRSPVCKLNAIRGRRLFSNTLAVQRESDSVADERLPGLQSLVKPFSPPSDTQTCDTAPRPAFLGLVPEELSSVTGLPLALSRTVCNRVYSRGITSFANMLDIPKVARIVLTERFGPGISIGEVRKRTAGADGTTKWLFEFSKGQVETVFIPEATRGTLCLSSQVGCSFSCKFCYTGTQPVVRNLTGGEIVGQVMQARQLLFDHAASPAPGRVISNIVYAFPDPLAALFTVGRFMGQGEPLYNYRNLGKALSILTDPALMAFSRRKIIVSTSGVVPNIHKLGQDWKGICLAISLHAVRDDLRNELVPINKQYPISQLLAAVRSFHGLRTHNRAVFEYVMLQGVNDTLADADELVRLIAKPPAIPAIVNLIPFNAWPGSPFQCSPDATIAAFCQRLVDSGVVASIRWPRGAAPHLIGLRSLLMPHIGRDILAACGQLKTETKRASAAATDNHTTSRSAVI